MSNIQSKHWTFQIKVKIPENHKKNVCTLFETHITVFVMVIYRICFPSRTLWWFLSRDTFPEYFIHNMDCRLGRCTDIELDSNWLQSIHCMHCTVRAWSVTTCLPSSRMWFIPLVKIVKIVFTKMANIVNTLIKSTLYAKNTLFGCKY